MTQSIACVAVVVRDYDEAKQYYSQVLGFEMVEDVVQENGKRWIVVSPPGKGQMGLLLQKAFTDEQMSRIGNQTGGKVFLFLRTDDFDRDYDLYQSRGVRFVEFPREESYGKVVKFDDMYGNRWDLLQLTDEFKR